MDLPRKVRNKVRIQCKMKNCKAISHGDGLCQHHYDRAKKDLCECGNSKYKRSEMCRLCRDMVRGNAHPAWKGGRIVDGDGYIRIYMPDHPRANNKRYVKEHHIVMEEYLGRHLIPGENVHHKNGNKTDNRIDNLELWVSSQPAGQRAQDLVDWAKDILERYDEKFNLAEQNPMLTISVDQES